MAATARHTRWVSACAPVRPARYRYLLHVVLAPALETGELTARRTLAVIQKNPSRADAERSDPTAGKVEAWARRNHFDAVLYTNLFAFRSPDPAALNRVAPADAVGDDNDAAILAACAQADVVVTAWGNPNGIERSLYNARIEAVLALLRQIGATVYCVGEPTRLGYPRHGLHWNGAATLRRHTGAPLQNV